MPFQNESVEMQSFYRSEVDERNRERIIDFAVDHVRWSYETSVRRSEQSQASSPTS